MEQALELANSRFPRFCIIADIGTGCGAIAIALASNLSQAKVYATDISAPALEVAAINCQRHGVTDQVQLLRGDLLDPIPEPVHLVVANLPYVRDSEIAELSAESRLFEPMIGLAGGEDGLQWIRKLLFQAGDKMSPDGAILMEIGYDQGVAVTSLARGVFPAAVISIVPDLCGHDRVVVVEMIQHKVLTNAILCNTIMWLKYIREVRCSREREEHIGKHNVTIGEVLQVLGCERPLFRKTRSKRYFVFGQTEAGRYLLIILKRVKGEIYSLVTARDMEDRERRRYRKSLGR